MELIILYVLLFAVVFAMALTLFLKLNPQFGGQPDEAELAKLSKSPQWNGKIFENQIETKMDMSASNIPGLLWKQLFDRKGRSPELPLPIIDFDQATWTANAEPKFIWYGHSVILLQLNGKNILIDPMLGPNTAPVAPFKVKRFSENTLAIIDQLPDLDAILISHDHYDHLDLASIKKLKTKTHKWIVALGVKRHLVRWGIPESTIKELDWWDEAMIEEIALTYTPSRHFSGRGLSDRTKSLWGGFAFLTDTFKVYWSGDGGEGPHFKEIGEKLGPFHWAFMEDGQYNALWHAIHMYPEESVKAGIEAKAEILTPVHWAGFPLALHHWKDPIERFVKAADACDQAIHVPQLGEIVHMNSEKHYKDWWKAYD